MTVLGAYEWTVISDRDTSLKRKHNMPETNETR